MTPSPGPPSDLLHTALHPEHLAAGATMTSFAGWSMPLRYGSELEEHRAVRERAGLFDLSHMGQIEVSGPAAAAALDRALVSACSALRTGRARYTLMTAPDGGVMDDLIVYRLAGDDFLVVANAANRRVVADELTVRSGTGGDDQVSVEDRTEHRALIALQGPRSADVLGTLTGTDLKALGYYAITTATVGGLPVLLARTGYTGEDGFELSVPAASAVALWRALLRAGADSGAVPCGLACRDSLRLEAGMPLYGHELTRAVTPYEAGLGRVVGLDHDFVGRDALAERRAAPSGTVLVGLVGEGRRAARAGCPVLAGAQEVGTITSGMLSPTLGHPIALALVRTEHTAPGTVLEVDVRGTRQPMTVIEPPFYRRPR